MEIIRAIFALSAIMMMPFVVIAIIMVISYWKIFKKAGKEGWEAIVPGYNIAILSSLAGITPYAGFVVLGLLIPGINSLAILALFALHVINSVKLAEAFGKDSGFMLGMILVPFIFYPMIAFDEGATYNKDYMFKGVGLSNYTNGDNNTNNNANYNASANDINATYSNPTENANVNQTAQTVTSDPIQTVATDPIQTSTSNPEPSNATDPIQSNETNFNHEDSNVDPIQHLDDDNNNNGTMW